MRPVPGSGGGASSKRRRRVLAAALHALVAITAAVPRPGTAAPAAAPTTAPSARNSAAGGRSDPTALIAAGAATLERLKTAPAAWTTDVVVGGHSIRIDTLRAPPRRRLTITSTDAAGRPVELVQVVERDDLWYVRERTDHGTRQGKYRAGECPFFFASAPQLFRRATLRVVTEADRGKLRKLVAEEAGVCTFRVPLPPENLKQVEAILRQADDLAAHGSKALENPQTREQLRFLKDLLAQGVPNKISRADGLLVEFDQTASGVTRIHNFRWLDHVNETEFATDGPDWADHSADPTAADPAGRVDWVMLGYDGMVDPGTGIGDSDGRVVDLRTGRIWRIPFDGGGSVPGCFLKDRGKVIVTGESDGEFGLYEVDLKTRVNRRLAAGALAGAVVMEPALSPDGTTLAGVAVNMAAGFQNSRLFLIDVKSGAGRPVGDPIDGSSVSWLPDGKAVVLEVRKDVAVDKPPESTICRIGLDGSRSRIIEGSRPVVLAPGRLLFRIDSADGKQWVWHTCNLEGKDVKRFGDGLTGFGFATPSPEGKRLLMIHAVPGGGQAPFVFPIDRAPGKPALNEPGTWATPRWQ